MNHPLLSSPVQASHPAGLRTARRAAAGLLLLASLLAGQAATAQSAPSAPSGETAAAAAAAAGAAQQPLTRAQVIAELECARASGELDAQMLRSYGLPPAQPPRAAGPGCTGPQLAENGNAAPKAAQTR